MTEYGIRYVAMASPVATQAEPPVGAWLEGFDPEAYSGRGLAHWTIDPTKAARFATKGHAFRAWRAAPRCHPKRADGRPNRPLTAFTVTIEELP